jgi:hypothetical protein
VSKTQGQLAAGTKDSSKLYRLTLTKEEMRAVRQALQGDYETLSELLSDDPTWEQAYKAVEKVLSKIRESGAESE